jgi:SAM-dependent methyltransferase
VPLPARLRRDLRAIRRWASPPGAIWERGLSSELGFWEEYFRTEGRQFPDGYRVRRDPDAPIADPLLLQAIDRSSSDPIRIVDVGAGPLTAVGRHDPRRPERGIEIVATDPLAEEYDRLLERFDVIPPVRTRPCRGEEIASTFGAGAFDIAHARNSVDHSADPTVILRNMAEAVAPRGSIVLHHYRREGEEAHYADLHQWNFDLEDGRLIVWSKRRRHDVGETLGDGATVTARIERVAERDWVQALITF